MNLLGKPRFTLGWHNFAFSLACTLLLATEIMVSRNAVLPQSAEAYYFEYPSARFHHGVAIAVDLVVLVATLAWILLPHLARYFRIIVVLAAVAGLVSCWNEIGWAARPVAHRVFLMRELPFRPLANFGLAGALVFGAYLVFSLPSGRMTGVQTALVKAGIAVSFGAMQFIMWDGIARNAGLHP